ncbi:MAG: DUF4150 domain-containing protein [Proteobacteria bacterium]|nr:DUF4150 domain-containing protein [Pseudomonadota bacterium]
MADKHIADGEPGFKAASSAPDVCVVGGSAVPFDSFQDLSKQKSYVDSVKARGKHLLTVGSVIAGSLGNAGSGVVSGTSQGSGDCTILTGANKVKAEGKPVARHLSDVAMNNGNTLGKLYTQSGQANGTIKDNRHPCNDPPKRSETLDKLEAFKQDLENNALNANRLDQYMRLDEKGEMLQEGIDTIRPGQDSSSFTQGAAGATRATLGFLKDAGLGIGQLAYAAAKRLSPVNKTLDQVNALILAENIRLGNVCMGQIGEQAKAMGQAIVKPVTDPWAKGDYAESVTRGGLELVTLLLPFTQFGKAGELANAAGKLGEAEKIGEGASVLGKAGEVEKTGEAVYAAVKMGETEKASEAGKVSEVENAADAGKVKSVPSEDGVKVKAKTNHEKAAFGEKTAHDKMVEKGYEPVGKTDGQYQPGKTGIDGMYKNPKPPPDYVVTEVKYGNAHLEKGLADGTNQMDDTWVRRRLVDKVGKEEADNITTSMNNSRVEKWLIRVEEDGTSNAKLIDLDGNVIRGNVGKVPTF